MTTVEQQSAAVGGRHEPPVVGAASSRPPVHATPSPATVPRPGRWLDWQRRRLSRDGYRPGWWLLAGHGGAGVSCLIRAGVSGGDAMRLWPDPRSGDAAPVVVVVRDHAYGLEWARDLAQQHGASGAPPGTQLTGLVVVASTPGRRPVRLRSMVRLLAGIYPRLWEIPWVEQWRLAGHQEPLPCPPWAHQVDQDMRSLVGDR